MNKVPAPLYRDPIYDGAADPTVICNEQDGNYYMFYTQRRANQTVCGTSFYYGTSIGVAVSEDGAYWYYLGALSLEFEFGHNTFWAPEVIYDPDRCVYHMYVSYIRGIHSKWTGDSTIEHYVSHDILHWERIGTVYIPSSKIIDPCIFRLPNKVWRMWYKDEENKSHTGYADSVDLYNWEHKGFATSDCAQEGPNVFEFDGFYWLIVDTWDGLGVYRSDDLSTWVRQEKNILRESGKRNEDVGAGAHADVFVKDGRAFIFYFTYPNGDKVPKRSSVQAAELVVQNGTLVCNRDTEIYMDWKKVK